MTELPASSPTDRTERQKRNANLRVAAGCVAFFGSMVGMAYAAVPLYQLFCQVTGFGGTPMLASQAPANVLEQTIKVRFDANVNGVPWEFAPKVREVEVKLGETMQIDYFARNIAQRVAAGTATFNVTPATAGAYFNKMQCFCFTDTALKPGETIDMPVVFFVDPAILDDPEASRIKTITLSYTFFPTDAENAAGPQAALTTPVEPSAATQTHTTQDGRS
ncbi:MAG: cytochrome c oxidase assembly protein [Rhizobiaceae bacterium]|jgi:cytochrome c oxidase assembly protein subunit 11|nr:cytochrome c oxidase assembly protein [Rhizobiaceae bacterium]